MNLTEYIKAWTLASWRWWTLQCEMVPNILEDQERDEFGRPWVIQFAEAREAIVDAPEPPAATLDRKGDLQGRAGSTATSAGPE